MRRRPDDLSPLTEPGEDVRRGDYPLAVTGREPKAPINLYSLFVGLDDQPVTLAAAESLIDSCGGDCRR